MTNYDVVWMGPLRKNSGLGIASREYVRALRRQGVAVVTEDKRPFSPLKQSKGRHQVLIYHHAPNTIRFSRERARFDRIILNTVWETSQIPAQWKPYMNKFDAICVPSRQNKAALINSGVKVPIYIVPHGIDHTKYIQRSREGHHQKSDRQLFIFVAVFGFQHRKNPEGLLRAYWKEFTAADHVKLIIKTNGYNREETKEWIKNQIESYRKRLGIRKPTAPILLITRRLNSLELASLYARGDVFVLPTRGEGVGLPFLEALASGLPVIATGWGGHMDFLTPRNSFLVSYRLQRPAQQMKYSIARPFRYLFAQKGQKWAEADQNSLQRQMRAAYQNPQLCKRKGQQGKLDTMKLTWDKAGSTMKQVVEKVIQQPKRS